MSAGTALVILGGFMNLCANQAARSELRKQPPWKWWLLGLTTWLALSLLWSDDLARGFKLMAIWAPLPWLVLLAPAKNFNTFRQWVSWSAVVAMLAMLIIGWWKGVNGASGQMEWSPFTSHIRLSMLAALGLGWSLLARDWKASILLSAAMAAFAWASGALSPLGFLPLAWAWWIGRSIPQQRRLPMLGFGIALLVTLTGTLVAYLQPVPLPKEPLAAFSPWGNPYQHRPEKIVSEGGHRIHLNECPQEWDSAWAMVSSIPLSTLNDHGYELRENLRRYLTSLGVRKDGYTIANLEPVHVAAIEQGANHHLPANGIIDRFRKLKHGYETWHDTGNPTGSSVMQRWEHWNAASLAWKTSPWIGRGMGGHRSAINEAYAEMKSKLKPGYRHGAHMQHLTVGVAGGLVGWALWLAFWVAWWRQSRPQHVAVVVLWGGLTLLVSCFYEDVLETQAGVLAAALALALGNQSD